MARALTVKMCGRGCPYPHPELLAWLAQGFAEWLAQGHQTPLEECLGLRVPSKGKWSNTMKLSRVNARLQHWLKNIHVLHLAFDMKVIDAANVMLAASTDGESNDEYQDDYLEGSYHKRFTLKHDPLIKGMFENATDDFRRWILAQIPKNAYEHLIDTYPKIKRSLP